MLLDLRRLTYFIAVAEELNFCRAATRLNIAQPPLSRQIAQLETDLEVVLFDRTRNQIRLTQAGAALLDHGRELLERAEQTIQETRSIGHGASGRLRLGYVGSAGHGVLPEMIRKFRTRYPEVDLSLSAMNNADLKRALISRQIDLALARPRLEDEEIRVYPLLEEPLILALPEESPLLALPEIRLSEIMGETFVLYPRQPRPGYADHVLEACRLNGGPPRDLAFAQDHQAALSLVAAGVGLALVPASVSRSRQHGVAWRPYVGVNPGTALSLNLRLDNHAVHVRNFIALTCPGGIRPLRA